MYSYTWDEDTGGILLNSSPLEFSKEPRPVYYKELDLLGFDKHWKYEKNDLYPYMWAEANNYFYRGRLVAKTKGGSLYTAPEIIIIDKPEPNDQPLRFVDVPAMVEKNKGILEKLVQETIKKVYNTYMKYKNKVDVFYVAFSGGKDSVVTLDIVQRALPHNAFIVLFGDTGMEFPDTYNAVTKIEKECKKKKINFIKSKSDFLPSESWKIFGPPSTVTRWCCSVHKTVPQILALRKLTDKRDFTGMAFIGVRASESLSRNDYDYVSLGEKHKGQYSCNPILEWGSAELYIYIYSENIYLNEAYKKGNNRAGCLVCPNVSEKNFYFRRACYKSEVNKFIDVISDLYKESIPNKNRMKEFLSIIGWKARMNGRDLSTKIDCEELTLKNNIVIRVKNPKTDWKEWIKTIGILLNDKSPYRIIFKNEVFEIEVKEENNNIEVICDSLLSKTAPLFIKLLKNVFHKAACCVKCRECEADCHNGCISMENDKLSISDKCVHCAQCHKIEKGCLVYKSLEMPKGDSKMEKKSLNRYSTHAPKMEWIKQYFDYKDEFKEKNKLGSQMFTFFKRFLKDSELLVNNYFSDFAKKIEFIGLNKLESWGLMLTNLSYTPQICWFIKNVNMNETALREYIVFTLEESGANNRAANDIFRSLIRFIELPFSEVGMGTLNKENGKVNSITRTPWRKPNSLVILYSLYKFAEACDGYYQFTLTRLLDHDIESNGVSPTQIFGIERDKMQKILTGLDMNYHDFISASFTLNLDTITLNSEKTSADVLELF